ncbi:Uncharacterized conserved protein YbbK, DUF523 family [Dethiosulfatibacter aminovorans DSM 17477]|uniref:Uncharacterized conserved protein YbbK, DUF523 family n=1 Tax=Dethiosulfatibacter aminovorans DSM 17477 TaxID=1121476 RepID=A0A1M6GYN7_9FIRM|nr:DUF523 domain-containing protein [Dethiosulfatibacter aminovorans]SHJ15042.1 Uncharacterized conserved protein YbbK, DUF523 family [Dethiosulfatibacter aminovorans DSM 17477]
MLVSACLLGLNCKYSGGNNYDERVLELLMKEKLIPVCPEQLGGLETPRIPCEIIVDGDERKVVNRDGVDLTEEFIRGAEETLKLAKLMKEDSILLQPRSPSCGCRQIYDGTFSGKLIEGEGITAELLRKNGIKVYDTEDYFSD